MGGRWLSLSFCRHPESTKVNGFSTLKETTACSLEHLLITHCVSGLSGGCKWIRTPAILYSAHVATTLLPILGHILFYQFPVEPHPGPKTLQERWLLVSIYAPYLLVPLLLLFTMLFSSTYNSASTKCGGTSVNTKKKNWLITRPQLSLWMHLCTWYAYSISERLCEADSHSQTHFKQCHLKEIVIIKPARMNIMSLSKIKCLFGEHVLYFYHCQCDFVGLFTLFDRIRRGQEMQRERGEITCIPSWTRDIAVNAVLSILNL